MIDSQGSERQSGNLDLAGYAAQHVSEAMLTELESA